MRDPIGDLVRRHGVDRVVEVLRPILTDERAERIEAVLDRRLTSVTVAIENLYDPHNGAAAIRSVEALGVTSMHVIEGTGPFRFSPEVTIGCDKWIALHRHPDVPSCAAALRAAGMRLVALVPDARWDVEEVSVDRPLALVFGNEHDGLSEAALAACDEQVRLPMYGFTRSFNLSVSVALATSWIAERRRSWLGLGGDLGDEERAFLRARWYALSIRAAGQILDRVVSEETRADVDDETRKRENH
jgi:tRNA (guanosine-2'-O-)-methyltransferase